MNLTETNSPTPAAGSKPEVTWQKLEEEGFPQILFRLFREKRTGLLYVSRSEHRISLVIYQGNPVFASSNNFEDSLGQMLVGKGILSRIQLMDTVKEAQRESKRLGMVLVQRGLIGTDDLKAFIKDQIRTIIFKIFAWEKGSFYFDPQDLGQRQTIHFEETTLGLILGGIRSQVSLKRLLSIGIKPQTVLAHERSAEDDIYRGYPWDAQLNRVLGLVDGKRKVEEILEASGLESQEALGCIWMLLVSERLTFSGQKAHRGKAGVLVSPFAESVPLKDAEDGKNRSKAAPIPVAPEEMNAWKDFSLSGEFDNQKLAIAHALWDTDFADDPESNTPAFGKKKKPKIVVENPAAPKILGDLEALERAYESQRNKEFSANPVDDDDGDIFNEITLDDFSPPPVPESDPGEITLEPLSPGDLSALTSEKPNGENPPPLAAVAFPPGQTPENLPANAEPSVGRAKKYLKKTYLTAAAIALLVLIGLWVFFSSCSLGP